MRWIDIDLKSPAAAAGAAPALDRAAARLEQMPDLQRREGLDSPVLMRFTAAIGQQLFRAAMAGRRDAFVPAADAEGAVEPGWPGRSRGRESIGFHLIVEESRLGLPWTWLHNGLRFLIETSPICVGAFGSDPAAGPDRPWCRRRGDVLLAGAALGPEPLPAVMDRLRPAGCAEPEILFLAGAGPAAASARSRGESALVAEALGATPDGRLLARLARKSEGVAPGELARLGDRYQGFHFAGTTATPGGSPLPRPGAEPPEPPADRPHTPGLAVAEPTASEAAAGARGEGDPAVAALLAEVAGAARRPLSRRRGLSSSRLPASDEPVGAWLLEDGPFRPEALDPDRAPALVFSNSFSSVRDLGGRFLASGVSAFVGTHMAIKPGFAAAFAADFYREMAAGSGAAIACRAAALSARARDGDHNPAWLAYGVAGCGALALPFL